MKRYRPALFSLFASSTNVISMVFVGMLAISNTAWADQTKPKKTQVMLSGLQSERVLVNGTILAKHVTNDRVCYR